MNLGTKTLELYTLEIAEHELKHAFESQTSLSVDGPEETRLEVIVTGVERQPGSREPRYLGRVTSWAKGPDGRTNGMSQDFVQGTAFFLWHHRLYPLNFPAGFIR